MLQLARAGARLEEAFGGPRDVEWAFRRGYLYLLQARPVTALFNWTDFELLHELDAPCVPDEDIITTANTGCVCVGVGDPVRDPVCLFVFQRKTLKIRESYWDRSI